MAGAGDAWGIGDAAGGGDSSGIGAGAGIGDGDGTALAWGSWPGWLLVTGVGSSTGLTINAAGVDVTGVASTSDGAGGRHEPSRRWTFRNLGDRCIGRNPIGRESARRWNLGTTRAR